MEGLRILQIDKCYDYGLTLYEYLLHNMPDGKPITCAADIGILTQMICASKGDHLEIGTAYGGTAIAAIKAMEYCKRDGKVVCIDPFKELSRDTSYHLVEKEFWNNIEVLGVQDRISLIRKASHPFPTIDGRMFGSALIDGDHSYESVKNDWLNIKDLVNGYIMFHDFHKPNVKKAVYEWVIPDKNWIIANVCGWSLVMNRY